MIPSLSISGSNIAEFLVPFSETVTVSLSLKPSDAFYRSSNLVSVKHSSFAFASNKIKLLGSSFNSYKPYVQRIGGGGRRLTVEMHWQAGRVFPFFCFDRFSTQKDSRIFLNSHCCSAALLPNWIYILTTESLCFNSFMYEILISLSLFADYVRELDFCVVFCFICVVPSVQCIFMHWQNPETTHVHTDCLK